MNIRQRLAQQLRFLADRIDPDGAPRGTGWGFTFENRVGVRFHLDGRGCKLWYLGNEAYDAAYLEAIDPPRIRIDWSTMKAVETK